MHFDFEKLDVYQVALDFVVSLDEVAHKLPRERRYLKNQLPANSAKMMINRMVIPHLTILFGGIPRISSISSLRISIFSGSVYVFFEAMFAVGC